MKSFLIRRVPFNDRVPKNRIHHPSVIQAGEIQDKITWEDKL